MVNMKWAEERAIKYHPHFSMLHCISPPSAESKTFVASILLQPYALRATLKSQCCGSKNDL
jgi:hypothetical protein